MIITSGITVYSQETGDVLITHKKVADSTIIGVPDPDFVKVVKTNLQPLVGNGPSEALAQEFMKFCTENLSKIKCPNNLDFFLERPLQPAGKLYKRLIRDRCWSKRHRRIV